MSPRVVLGGCWYWREKPGGGDTAPGPRIDLGHHSAVVLEVVLQVVVLVGDLLEFVDLLDL
eukprot:3406823-Prorocentrum_lima.AAC.1